MRQNELFFLIFDFSVFSRYGGCSFPCGDLFWVLWGAFFGLATPPPPTKVSAGAHVSKFYRSR